MANSAGNPGSDNSGKTDQGRGEITTFVYSKGQRSSQKVGGSGSIANSNTVDGNKITRNDHRLTK